MAHKLPASQPFVLAFPPEIKPPTNKARNAIAIISQPTDCSVNDVSDNKVAIMAAETIAMPRAKLSPIKIAGKNR